jgi:predicted Zn-dependent protease
MRNLICNRSAWLGAAVVIVLVLGLTYWASGEGTAIPAKSEQAGGGLASRIEVRIQQSGEKGLEKVRMAVALQAKNTQTADALFKEMKSQGMEDDYAAFGYAKSMSLSGQAGDSIKCFDALLGRHPNNPTILYEMGMVHIRRGGDEGITYMKRVVEIDPFYSRANLQLAHWSAARSDNAKAIEYARRVLAVEDPGSSVAEQALLLLDKLIPANKA